MHRIAVRDEFLDDFVTKLFAAHRSIRFICMTDSKGHVLGSAYRKNVTKRMTEDAIEKIARPWVMQTLIATGLQESTDELVYMLAVFQRTFAATIPISFNPKDRLITIISFEITIRDPRRIIEEKILPLIGKNKDYFI